MTSPFTVRTVMPDASTSGSKVSSSASASPASSMSPIRAPPIWRTAPDVSPAGWLAVANTVLPSPSLALAIRPRVPEPAGSGTGGFLVHRRPVDLLDGRVELGVELLVGLALRQPLQQRAREAGDEGGIAGEQVAGLVPAVAAGQCHDPQHARVGRQVAVQADLGRDGDLQHHGRALGQRLDVLGDGVVQQYLGLLLVRAGDADL